MGRCCYENDDDEEEEEDGDDDGQSLLRIHIAFERIGY